MFFCIAGHVLASFCIAGHFLASFLIAGHVFCIAFNRGTKIQKQAAATQTVLRHGVTAVTGPRRRRRCSWRPADRPCGRRRCRCTHCHPSNHAGAAAALTAARISSPARLSPAATAAVQREKSLRQQQWQAGARQEADGGGGDAFVAAATVAASCLAPACHCCCLSHFSRAGRLQWQQAKGKTCWAAINPITQCHGFGQINTM